MYSSICASSATSLLVLFKGHTCASSRHVLHYIRLGFVQDFFFFLEKMDILGKKKFFVGEIRRPVVVHSEQDVVHPFSVI